MKTILLMLLSIVLSLEVSAQRKGDPDGHNGNSEERNEYHSRGYIVPLYYGWGYNYSPYYGYSYFGYPYYDYPYYGYRFRNRPPHNGNKSIQYGLSLQIKAIKMDYKNKIRQVRHDKSVSHSQKKQKIFSLKTERNQSIVNAEKDFLNELNTGIRNPGMKNNLKPGKGNAPPSMIQ